MILFSNISSSEQGILTSFAKFCASRKFALSNRIAKPMQQFSDWRHRPV